MSQGLRPIAATPIASLQGGGPLPPNPPDPPNPPQPQPQPRPPVQDMEPVVQLDQSGRLQQLQWVGLGPTKGPIIHDEPATLEYLYDGGGVGILPGISGFLTIPQWLLIQSWTLLLTSPGIIEMDVLKLPLSSLLAGTAFSAGDSICGGSYPSISSGLITQSTNVDAWDTFIVQNDVLAFSVRSATNISRATLILNCLVVKLQ